MKKLVTFASDIRVNALLCSSLAVLLTACGGSTTDSASGQTQTAAYMVDSAAGESDATATGATVAADATQAAAAEADGSAAPDFSMAGYAEGELSPFGKASAAEETAAPADGSTRLLAATTAVTTAASVQDQVSELYRTLLGREPDSGGLQFWSGMLSNGALTIDQIAAAFKASPEYQNRNNGGGGGGGSDTITGIPATTYNFYVSPNGSDTAAGTKGAPFKTIQRAAKAATKASTTVWVAPGTYSGGIKTTANGTSSGRIYYVSTTKHGAKIVPPANSTMKQAWDNRGNYVNIVGFDVNGSAVKSGTKWVNGIYTGGSYGMIQSNRVQFIARTVPCNSAGGSAIGSDSYYKGVWTDVVGNIVNDIGPANCKYVQGIYISTSGSVKNNLAYRAGDAAIHLWHDANNVTITNNTVTQSRFGIIVGGGDYYHRTTGADNVKVHSNIVYDNSYGISEMGKTGSNNSYLNNLIFKNATPTTLRNGLTAKNTIAKEPLFVSYSRGSASPNFKLTSGSPAIGKGTAAGAHPTDYDGRPRNASTGYTIGAYQH